MKNNLRVFIVFLLFGTTANVAKSQVTSPSPSQPVVAANNALPTNPTEFISSNVTQVSTELSWNASTSDRGIEGYEVYRDGVLWGSTSATSMVISGLQCNTNHQITVKAVDIDGNRSEPGSSINVSTMDCSPVDPNFFPISVYWQTNTSNYQQYKDAGFDIIIMTQDMSYPVLQALKNAGMQGMFPQADWALGMINESNASTIFGWVQRDEPDNAQYNPKTDSYDPCINPQIIVDLYKEWKSKDPVRPVYLGLGCGVAATESYTRGTCQGDLDSYRMTKNGYTMGCDIASFDVYPVNGNLVEIKNNLWYVPKGVDSLKVWTLNSKPVWTSIETTQTLPGSGKPTPVEVKAEVWMALVHGVTGICYFPHTMEPFDEAALLHDTEMIQAVTEINAQIKYLAPVLNSVTTTNYATVQTSLERVPIDIMTKNHDGFNYIFAVPTKKYKSQTTSAIFTVSSGTSVEVIGENRTIDIVNGQFTDTFSPYQVHLYKIGTSTGIDNSLKEAESGLMISKMLSTDEFKVTYKVPVAGLVSMKVYDMMGKEVTTIINKEIQTGDYNQSWQSPTGLSSGIYFIRMVIQPLGRSMPIVVCRKFILS